ncbi:MAG: ATP-grasp domain-containing protein [Bacteriovoracaceae bacterium]|nr:ATP-grasp domain-containing protein [Bacteriovoracaceae bacterium]
MKIKKVLIANRGEISLRVARTCAKMGIASVSIYSETDKDLPHAKYSEESYSLGMGSLAQTYLDQDKIIKIAKDCGADAIHPGYGFLSENTEFCKKVIDAGIKFIGPSVSAIELMGDKKTSKVKMEALGIPLVPGYHGNEQDSEFLLAEAKKIGFPVLVKATAGGGGKGMRIVETEQDFTQALEGAKREAKNAFGNDKVLLEKYIINPRHIEVQLVSDGQGNHYHFYERECSIQRRYQKVIEETPSTALDQKLRDEMCACAVKIAEGIEYVGAGTIEYILAPDNSFYFLEMNTRLQVEHPVTEMVTGYDLVELQILAAAGEAFSFKQSDIKQSGHSLEMRIYAEDPDNDFLPSIGKIFSVGEQEVPSARLDSGFEAGNYVSIKYDPMLAKLIVHGSNRKEAMENAIKSLNDFVFSGVKTNRDYLRRILKHPKFIEGDIHTHFIQDYKDDLGKSEFQRNEKALLIAAALSDELPEKNGPWNNVMNFRNV